LKQLSHPHIVKMVQAKLDDESFLASSMQALKVSDQQDKKRERNRSGESSKSAGSSGGSSSDDKQQPCFWIDVSQNRYILLEWAENGDLFDFTIGLQEPIGEQLARYYFLQILSATEYLHMDQKIVHRDFKLENILVDGNFNLKICDFTLAKTVAEGSIVGVFYSNVGTERYMAPEIHEGKPYKGTTTDIFALGVILFVLVTGVMPFHSKA
jgi:serine/threonine protein kinase